MGSTARIPQATAEDYRAFREGAVAVPLELWAVFRLTGPDTAAFLQGLASQDLPPGSSRRTYFLTEKGRPLALAWVHVSEDGASGWVVTDEGAKETLLPHFERFRVMEEVEFEDASDDFAVLGVAGGSSGHLSGAGPAIRVETDPLSVVLVPRSEQDRIRTAHPAVFEPWRIAAGLPRSGVDFDLDRIATELDDPGAISLTKGCYVGQEVVARTSNRGQVRRRRTGFRFDGAAGAIPPKALINSSNAQVGFVTSSAVEPGSTQGVAMGYVSMEALSADSDLVAVQGDMTTPLRPVPGRRDPT